MFAVELSAIAQVESNHNPLAFHVNRWQGEDYQTSDPQLAVETVDIFRANGFSVDVGLMQINSKNLERFGVKTDEAFDACTSVRLGERILHDAMAHARATGHIGDEAVRAALSIYNTGNMTRGFSNGYVDKVWAAYNGAAQQQARFSNMAITLDRGALLFDFQFDDLNVHQSDDLFDDQSRNPFDDLNAVFDDSLDALVPGTAGPEYAPKGATNDATKDSTRVQVHE